MEYIPELRFLIGNLSGFEALLTENAGGKECVTVSTSELYFESLHESSKVPVWDVTFSDRIYYVFPNTHRSCTVPVNITFSETGSLKGRVLFWYLNTEAGPEKGKTTMKKIVRRRERNMIKIFFPLSISNSFLLLFASSPCDLFFIFYFVLLKTLNKWSANIWSPIKHSAFILCCI